MSLDRKSDVKLAGEFSTFSINDNVKGTLETAVEVKATVATFHRETMTLIGAANVRPDGTWETQTNSAPNEKILTLIKDDTGLYNCDVYDRVKRGVVPITTELFDFENWILDNLQAVKFNEVLKAPGSVKVEGILAVENFYVENVTTIDLLDDEQNVVDVEDQYIVISDDLTVVYDNGTIPSKLKVNALSVGGVTDILGDGSCFFSSDFLNDGVSEDGTIGYHQSFTQYPTIDKVSGKVVGCRSFTNLNQEIDINIPLSAIFPLSFSFMFCAKVLPYYGYSGIVFISGDSSINMNLYLLSNGKFQLYKNNNPAVGTEFTGYTYQAGTHIHITVTYAVNRWELYINGNLIGSVAHADFLKVSYAAYPYVRIGGATYMSNPFKIYRFRLFNKILNSTEVAQIYNADVPTYSSTLPVDSLSKVHTGGAVRPIGIRSDIDLLFSFYGTSVSLLDRLYSSTVVMHNNILYGYGMEFSGASILHKVAPYSAIGGNSSLPDQNSVSIVGRFKNYNMLISGTRCIYKSGDGTNGIGVYISNSSLVICGRDSGSLTTLSIPISSLALNSDYIFVYSDDSFYLYNAAFTLLGRVYGQVVCGAISTDQESIGNSAGNSPFSGNTNAAEWFKGVLRQITILEKGTLSFESKKPKCLAAHVVGDFTECPIEVFSIDPVYNSSKIRVIVPEISNEKNLKLRIYADGTHSENPNVTKTISDIPVSASDDWNAFLSSAEADTLGVHDVLKLKDGINPDYQPLDYLSFNFPPDTYALSGDYRNTVTRVGGIGKRCIVYSNITVDLHKVHRFSLYCEFVVNTNSTNFLFGFCTKQLSNDPSSWGSENIYLRHDNNGWRVFLSGGSFAVPVAPIAQGTVIRLAMSGVDTSIGINDQWIGPGGALQATPAILPTYHYGFSLYTPFVELLDVNSSVSFYVQEHEFKKPIPTGYNEWSSDTFDKAYSLDHTSFLLLPIACGSGLSSYMIQDFSPAGGLITKPSSACSVLDNSVFGYGYGFTLGGSYLSFPSSSVFHPESYDYSLDFYMIRGGYGTSEILMGTRDAQGYGLYLALEDQVLSFYYMQDGIQKVKNGVKRIYDTEEHHIALTIKSGIFYLFIDGVLDLVSPIGGSITGADTVFSIGNAGNSISNRMFTGYIECVRIFKGRCRWDNDFTIPLKLDYVGNEFYWWNNGLATAYADGRRKRYVSSIISGVSNIVFFSDTPVKTGKIYFEVLISGYAATVGLEKATVNRANYVGASVGSLGLYASFAYKNNVAIAMDYYPDSYISSVGYQVVIGVAVDFNTGKVCWSVNGCWVNNKNPENGEAAVTLSATDMADGLLPAGTGVSSNFYFLGKESEFYFKCPDGFTAFSGGSADLVSNNPFYFSGNSTDLSRGYALATTSRTAGSANNVLRESNRRIIAFRSGYAVLSSNLCWVCASTMVTNQKVCFDLLEPAIDDFMTLINQYDVINGYPDCGIRQFSLYCTNSQVAFQNTVYSDVTDLVLLGEFTALNSPDQIEQIFKYQMSVPYRYRVLRIANNYGNPQYMSFIYAGFHKRNFISDTVLAVSIDSRKIDTDLENFPLLLSLSESSGSTELDASDVFTALGSNFSKLRILDSFGTVLSTEVRFWDEEAKKARLQVKVPKILGSNVSTYSKQYFAIEALSTGLVNMSNSGITVSFTNYPGRLPTYTEDYSVNGHYGTRFLSYSLNVGYGNPIRGTTPILASTSVWCMHGYFVFEVFATYNNFPFISFYRGTYGYDNGHCGLTITSAGELKLYAVNYTSGDGIKLNTGVFLLLNKLYHLALTCNKGLYTIYLDGLPVFTAHNDYTELSVSTSFEVGVITNAGGLNCPGFVVIMPSLLVGTTLWTSKFTPPTDFLSDNYNNTSLYITYDTSLEDNILIGASGTSAAQDVWDDFVLVYHMDYVTGGYLKDSTSNQFDAQLIGCSVIDGKLHLSGINSYAKIQEGATAYTIYSIEMSIKLESGELGGWLWTENGDGQGIGYNNSLQSYYGGIISGNVDHNLSGFVPGGNSIGGSLQNYPMGLEPIPSISESEYRTVVSTYDLNNLEYGTLNKLLSVKYYTEGQPYVQLCLYYFTIGTILGYESQTAWSLHGDIGYFRISNVKRSKSWMDTTKKSEENTLCSYRFTGSPKFVSSILPSWEAASISEFTVDTSALTETLTNFPLSLYFNNSSGLLSEDYTGFFDSLAVDALALGNIVRDYKLGAEVGFSGLLLDNKSFGSSEDVTVPCGWKFIGGAYDAAKAVTISTMEHYQDNLTVAFRMTIGEVYTGDTHRLLVCTRNVSCEFAVFLRGFGEASYINFAQTGLQGNAEANTSYTVTPTDRIVFLPGVEHAVVITRELEENGFRISIYVDSILLVSSLTAITSISLGSDGKISIGSYFGYPTFDGVLNDVLISRDVFSEEDIFDYTFRVRKPTDLHYTALFEQDYTIPILKGTALSTVTVEHTSDHGNIYVSMTFDKDTYWVYVNSSWKSIASRNSGVHGNVGTAWHYKDSLGIFQLADIDNPINCISQALTVIENRALVSSLQSWNFATSEFNAITGICDVACTFSYVQATPLSKLPEITSVYFNNEKVSILNPISLEEFTGIITRSEVHWEYLIGSELIDLSDKIKVYCKLSGTDYWMICAQDEEIPCITAGMITVGKYLHIKLVVDALSDIVPDGVNIITKLI